MATTQDTYTQLAMWAVGEARRRRMADQGPLGGRVPRATTRPHRLNDRGPARHERDRRL